jgi:hypothetical protein
VFWLPSLAFAIAFAPLDSIDLSRPQSLLSPVKVRRFCLLLIAFVLAVAANYFLFVRPNYGAMVSHNWDEIYHAYLTNGASVVRLIKTVASLTIPRIAATGVLLPLLIVLIFVAGAVRIARGLFLADKRAAPLFLSACLPVLGALAASALRQYPVLDYPRLLIWMLPCFGLLFCMAIEPVVHVFMSARLRPAFITGATVVVCAVASAASYGAVRLSGKEVEQNRELFERLQVFSSHGDCLFIHATVAMQFELYRNWLHWNPQCVYIGNANWPCCVVNIHKTSSDPRPGNLPEDIAAAIAKLHPHTLWLALQGGAPGTWSTMPPQTIADLPRMLQQLGCVPQAKQQYGNVMLMRADCSATAKDASALSRTQQ